MAEWDGPGVRLGICLKHAAMTSGVRGRRFQQNVETDDLGLRSSKILADLLGSGLVTIKWESAVASVFANEKLHVLYGLLHELCEAQQRLLPPVTHSCSFFPN